MVVNEGLLVACAFVVLVALIYRPTKKILFSILDQNSKLVNKALDEADAIHQEARNNLVKIQQELVDAKKQAGRILSQAEQETIEMIKSAKERAESMYEKKLKALEENFKAQESEIIQAVKEQAINQAIEILQNDISNYMDNENLSKALDKAISNLKKTVH